MLAWHFVNKTLRDGRPIPADKVWLEHSGPVKMCSSGLHASRRIIDALKYAPGSTLCRVRMKGDIQEDTDKLVGRHRQILWRIDGEEMLRAFTRWCAIQVLDQWDPPKSVLNFLATGQGRNAARSAASSATRSAAWNAARSAASSAAWSAAWSAAPNAAWSATRSATRSAASNAAWSATRSAAWSAQEKALREFVKEAKDGVEKWEFTW